MENHHAYPALLKACGFLMVKGVFLRFLGFPPPAYVIPPPVAFSMSSGYTFPGGVSVPGTFLQPTAHSSAGNQVQGGKQSHIPYSQQRPSGPGPMNQGPQQSVPPSQQPLTSLPAQATAQSASQLQVQALAQQQQSPTKAVQALRKSPPHHSGFQQVNLKHKNYKILQASMKGKDAVANIFQNRSTGPTEVNRICAQKSLRSF